MPTRIEVNRTQLNRIIARLRRIESPNTQRLHESIGRRIEPLVARGFIQQRDPYGVPWKPLADSTIRGRRRRGRGARILQDTGVMRNSTGFVATTESVEVGFADPKAKYHQTGTRKGVPQRAVLPYDEARGFPRDWNQATEAAAVAWLTEMGFS